VRTSTVGTADLAPDAGRADGGRDSLELADDPHATIEAAITATATGPITF
jgi:hypothetical protein